MSENAESTESKKDTDTKDSPYRKAGDVPAVLERVEIAPGDAGQDLVAGADDLDAHALNP